MRYAVRALGWATKILWILIIVFSGTSIYSAMNVRIGFGQSQVFLSGGFVVISFPFFVNNTGFYDLSELNVTANVMDYNESLVSTSTTFVPLIPRGSIVETAHNIFLNIDDIISKAQTYLFNDTVFNVNMSIKLKFAHAIPLQILMNTTIPWGAPLYNLSTGQISYGYYNLTHQKVIIPLSFENHSPYFGINGTMQIEIYNSRDELVGFRTLTLNVPPYSRYEGEVELIVDVSKLTASGEVHFSLETSMFSFGPVVMSYG